MTNKLRYEPPPQESIDDAARHLCSTATRLRTRVWADFNGIELVAEPGSDTKSVIDQFDAARQRRAEAHQKKKYARVVRFDFDSMENHIENAVLTKELALFGDEPSLSARTKAEKFVADQPREEKYKGWDSKEYPRFEIEEGELR